VTPRTFPASQVTPIMVSSVAGTMVTATSSIFGSARRKPTNVVRISAGRRSMRSTISAATSGAGM